MVRAQTRLGPHMHPESQNSNHNAHNTLEVTLDMTLEVVFVPSMGSCGMHGNAGEIDGITHDLQVDKHPAPRM